MYKILILFLLFPFSVLKSQENNKGILFQDNLSWNQVKEKATSEQKLIFVDYYATWCIPCKEMDRKVYISEEVGNFMNNKFISVKVQADSSKNDDEQVKKWYAIAKDFKEDYRIDAFPTYLFFSSNGEILHKSTGFKMPNDFIVLIKEATDSNSQFYTQLRKYRSGVRNYKAMPSLAKNVFNYLGDRNLASKIADDYNKNYLNKLDKDELLTKESIEFITWHPRVLSSSDRYFDLFYKNSKQVDSVMNTAGFSSSIVDLVIQREEVQSKLYTVGKPNTIVPDWQNLSNTIKKKYGKERAERIILDGQVTWYIAAKDWNNVVKYNVKKLDKYGIDTSFWGRFFLNNMVWDVIFKHSNDKAVLKKAIAWMEVILKLEPSNVNSIDTYANILYKAGRKEEAIKWQEKALEMDPENTRFSERLSKMKNGKPTWPEK